MSVYYKGTKFTAQGVDDYEQLQNKPSVNGIPLIGSVIIPAIDTVSFLPTIPDSTKLYRQGTTLNWYSGTGWIDLSSANLGSVGNATNPVYSLNGALVQGSTYAGGTSLNINGTSKASAAANIYAPAESGTSGQVLKSNGTNMAPTWEDNTVELSLNGATKTVTKENVYIYAPTAGGTAGQVLKSNGINNVPTWSDASTKMTLNGAEKDVTTTDVNVYAPITSGTSGQILISKGANQAPEWSNAASGGQSCWYGDCDTAANAEEKKVTCEGFTLTTGSMITVKFAADNTVESPQLNVNSTGAKNIQVNGANLTANRNWGAGCSVTFVYDGTSWMMINMAEPIDWYAVCSTAAATAAKTVTIDGFKLYNGAKIKIKFSNIHNSTSAATLNVNSTGAKTIRYRDASVYYQNSWLSNSLLELVYDGTYWEVQGMMNDPTPVGTMLASFSSSTPAGYIFCNGAAVSRTTYSNLWNTISTSFGAGDGSTTFNVPNMNGKFLMGATSGIRGSVSAGLPNIYATWKVEPISHTDTTRSGAVSISGGKTKLNGMGAGSAWNQGLGEQTFTFSASSYNSIYGNSSTVQPPSYKVYYYIKY